MRISLRDYRTVVIAIAPGRFPTGCAPQPRDGPALACTVIPCNVNAEVCSGRGRGSLELGSGRPRSESSAPAVGLGWCAERSSFLPGALAIVQYVHPAEMPDSRGWPEMDLRRRARICPSAV